MYGRWARHYRQPQWCPLYLLRRRKLHTEVIAVQSADLLWQHLYDLPAFRALLRAVEARFYEHLPLPRPVLDLGCGDGHFASLTFYPALEVGLDPWWHPLVEARSRSAYRVLTMANGERMPYPSGYFATVVSNSVLEHIPDLSPVLAEVYRVLRPGGWFYFCVPGPAFLPFLSVGRAMDRLGLRALGDGYRRLFNQIARHYHSDGVVIWQRRLTDAGLVLTRWWPYFTRRALVALEWGHYFGLPSLVWKKLTGRWILAPTRANLWPVERCLRPLYEESLALAESVPADELAGACLFFVAQKPQGLEREAK
ncbi:MAG TPA: class I SAM-dependent methyltransferase [Chloroflexi bacterium]|nr:class I SAM-dependent methyltransferase [Chloroflexota bacterium]